MLRPLRFVVLAFLLLFGAALPSQGAPPRTAPREPRGVAVFEWTAQAFARLRVLLAQSPRLKEGLGADPHGACATGPAPACGTQLTSVEEGPGADPHGAE
jgi:hypothetical protein